MSAFLDHRAITEITSESASLGRSGYAVCIPVKSESDGKEHWFCLAVFFYESDAQDFIRNSSHCFVWRDKIAVFVLDAMQLGSIDLMVSAGDCYA